MSKKTKGKTQPDERTATPAKGSATRIEVDLLGKMEIPNDAYYGIHTLRAVDNFQISGITINDIPNFIRGMVQVKKAAAMANRRLHTLPRDKADAIVWGM